MKSLLLVSRKDETEVLKFARRQTARRFMKKAKARGTISRRPTKVNELFGAAAELLLAKPRKLRLVSATQVITMRVFIVLKKRPDLA